MRVCRKQMSARVLLLVLRMLSSCVEPPTSIVAQGCGSVLLGSLPWRFARMSASAAAA